MRKKVPHHLLDAEHKVDAINAIKVINKHPDSSSLILAEEVIATERLKPEIRIQKVSSFSSTVLITKSLKYFDSFFIN